MKNVKNVVKTFANRSALNRHDFIKTEMLDPFPAIIPTAKVVLSVNKVDLKLRPFEFKTSRVGFCTISLLNIHLKLKSI